MIYARLAARRVLASGLLIVLVVSASWLLTSLGPGQAALAPGGFLVDDTQGRSGKSDSGVIGWWRAAVSLDFGVSTRYQRPVLPLVVQRAGNSALLGGAALLLAISIGIPLGFVSSRSTWAAHVVRAASVVLISCPPLVTAMVLTWLAVRAGWQMTGAGDVSAWRDPAALGRVLALPTIAIALPLAATIERLQSRALARVASEPWLDGLATRGLSPAAIDRHAWRAALPPVASVGGVIAGTVLGGSLAVEVITAWPGLGRLTFDAVLARDAALAAGCAVATSTLVSAAALASDLLVAWADPRAREAA